MSFRTLAVIVIPLVIAVASMMLASFSMLQGISESVDRQEKIRTQQAAESVIHSIRERMEALVADNAYWDDAAVHAAKDIDEAWVTNIWGTTVNAENYSIVFILDPKGKPIVTFRDAHRTDLDPDAFLGPGLRSALASLPRDGATDATVSAAAMSPDGFVVFGAAPICPNTRGDSKLPSCSNLLVLVRVLDRDEIAALGDQYIVDNLQITSISDSDPTAFRIIDDWGNPVAAATWTNRKPGDAARQNYRRSTLVIILSMLFMMLPLSVIHFRTLMRLEAESRKAAVSARRDSLSTLPNRLHLIEALYDRLNAREAGPVVLIYVDLDGFKGINDNFGHNAGDQLLRGIAAGLSSMSGPDDIIARLGGDEFALVIRGAEARQAAEQRAELILDFLREPFDLDGRVITVGASIGLAERGNEPIDAIELMRRADLAMYDAKKRGRNQWRWFDRSGDQQRAADAAIAAELREIIARRQLDIAYQPIVEADSGRIIGVEALARWPSVAQVSIAPDQFIAIAEEHGMISELGALVFDLASRDISGLPGLRLCVNVSPLQLLNGRFVNDICTIAETRGFALDRLELELTERMLMHGSASVRERIRALQQRGVRFALDDFGTGYASVGYLREFGFNTVKLDRSLTHTILTDPSTAKVVQGVALIAAGLVTDIVAEGIESKEQMTFMRLAGCNLMQGYHVGRPQSIEGIAGLLQHRAEHEADRDSGGPLPGKVA